MTRVTDADVSHRSSCMAGGGNSPWPAWESMDSEFGRSGFGLESDRYSASVVSVRSWSKAEGVKYEVHCP